MCGHCGMPVVGEHVECSECGEPLCEYCEGEECPVPEA
jgi:hypothetical protein